MKTVLLIGASNNPARFSNMAMKRLTAEGYRVVPVNPFSEILSAEKTVHHLSRVNEKIDVAVVYVRPEILRDDIDELVRIAPSEVIFNPGSESGDLRSILEKNGIQSREACTLVLLSSGQFEREVQ